MIAEAGPIARSGSSVVGLAMQTPQNPHGRCSESYGQRLDQEVVHLAMPAWHKVLLLTSSSAAYAMASRMPMIRSRRLRHARPIVPPRTANAIARSISGGPPVIGREEIGPKVTAAMARARIRAIHRAIRTMPSLPTAVRRFCESSAPIARRAQGVPLRARDAPQSANSLAGRIAPSASSWAIASSYCS